MLAVDLTFPLPRKYVIVMDAVDTSTMRPLRKRFKKWNEIIYQSKGLVGDGKRM